MFSSKERKCKIVIIGPRGSGKVLQFVTQTYLLKEITNVHSGVFYVGGPPVDSYKRDHFVGSNIMKLELWDTHWRQIPSIVSHCQGADGVILTFDITEKASFEGMKKQHECNFITKVELLEKPQRLNPDVIFLLVGCKSDLESKKEVSNEMALAYAKSQRMHYFETSVINGTNCSEALDYIVRQILVVLKNKPETVHLISDNQQARGNTCF